MTARTGYQSIDTSYGRPSYKLFVGCISYDAEEADLIPIFSSFGEIVEFTIQRDREGRSRGCAWLKYDNHDACENCIATLSNKYYVNGMRSAIVVKYANPQEPRISLGVAEGNVVGVSTKLFVGGYPVYATDDEIIASLSMFGEVEDFSRLSRMGLPTGPVFVTFFDPVNAQTLLNANGATIFMNSNSATESVPVTLRVSAAFSPVSNANSTPSVASRASEESPLNQPCVTTPPNGVGKLFVGCLPYSRTSEDLTLIFSQYGPLVEVALLSTPEGKSKGAAFITFVNREDAAVAARELQGFVFPNSSRGINISFASKQTRPARQLYGGPSPSSSATTYSTNGVTEDPITPPGFSVPTIRLDEESPATSFETSTELFKYLSTPSRETSPFSILNDDVTTESLQSLFGALT